MSYKSFYNNFGDDILLICALSASAVFASNIITPILPSLSALFAGLPKSDYWLKLFFVAPALGLALTSPFSAKILKEKGLVGTVVVAFIAFITLGTLGYWISSPAFLILSRILIGASSALLIASAFRLVTIRFEGNERFKIFGLKNSSMALAGILTSFLGASVSAVDVKLVFLLFLSGLPLLVFFLRKASFLQERDKAYSITYSQKTILPSFEVTKSVLPVLSLALVAMMIINTLPMEIAFFLQEKFGLGAQGISLAFTTVLASSFIAGSFYGDTVARIPVKWGLGISFSAIGMGFISLSSTVPYLIPLSIIGLGVGLVTPNLMRYISIITPKAGQGFLFGVLMSTLYLGQFLSVLMAAAAGALGIKTFALSGCLSIACGFFSLTLKNTESFALSNAQTNLGSDK